MFNDPLKALDYLIEQNPQKETRLSKIYNHRRFDEISVIVVDYTMPHINGLSICEQLKDKPFKKLLLITQAQEEAAEQAFNQNLIHKYIRKDSPNFTLVLNAAIYDLLCDYFAEQFQTHNSVAPQIKQELSDKIQPHRIVEYYSITNPDAFLLLDDKANQFWLGEQHYPLKKNEILSYKKYLETA